MTELFFDLVIIALVFRVPPQKGARVLAVLFCTHALDDDSTQI